MDLAGDSSILVVSYHFPPSSAVGGRRVARFCRYLPEFGIHPTLLTIDEASCEAVDLSFQVPDQLGIMRVRPAATILDWYKRRASKWSGEAKNSSKPIPTSDDRPVKLRTRWLRLQSHLFSLLQFPDMHRGWYKPAVQAGIQMVRDLKLNAVFSSAPPWTAHAVAHTISRRLNIPWVADFRDAWVSDVWRKYAYDSCGFPGWRNRLDLRMEDRWVRDAALVICTTDQHRDSLLRQHHRLEVNRVVTICNGFDYDSSKTPRGSKANSGQRILLHAGNLYGGRRVDTFCQAIALLVSAGHLEPSQLKVVFLGHTEPPLKHGALSAAPAVFENGMVAFEPAVSWKKTQQVVAEADVLLIFQGDHPTAIPAKFFEYLESGKPILAVAENGALKDAVLNTRSGLVADPHDPDAIATAVLQALKLRPKTPQEIQCVAERYNFRKLTRDLARSIHSSLGSDRSIQEKETGSCAASLA